MKMNDEDEEDKSQTVPNEQVIRLVRLARSFSVPHNNAPERLCWILTDISIPDLNLRLQTAFRL